jgi:hypothetical protein
MIHHGIPDVPFVDPNFYKDKFGVEGRFVLLTFGLLSANKGIEFVIEALPAILQRCPNVVFIVFGATHPHVVRQEGESYRMSLERLAESLGVEQHVLFHNRFVSLEELVEFIGAADVYVTPYLNPAQIVSGTLAYTVGAGKAVVSTPYWYAEELLSGGRGVLVPFRDASAIAERVISLWENEAERHAMRKRAYMLGREMIWSQVSQRYRESFERARADRLRHPRPALRPRTLDKRPGELPPVRLDHLASLTDDTGILQHSVFGVPNYHEGYTTDDNARGLVAAALLMQLDPATLPQARKLAARSLAFLWYAFNSETGRFRNFMSYDRRWLEAVGSEDSHGRAVWGLGLACRLPQAELRGHANRMIAAALPATTEFRSPRACAFTLLGLHEYLQVFPGDRPAQQARDVLLGRMLDWYHACAASDWQWFEDRLAYCNAALPHALLVCGNAMNRPDVDDIGLNSLRWLVDVQRHGTDHLVPIGTLGFYVRGGERARFDQQPVETQSTVSACQYAFRITGEARWHREAKRAFEWFLGRNDLKLPLVNPATGACRDGLHPDRVNQNEGAEATLSYLISLVEMRLAEPSWKQRDDGRLEPARSSKVTDQREAAFTK